MEKKFYRCAMCGNLVVMMRDSGVVPVCCNQPMTLLTANTVDASQEKHVPAATRNGAALTVQVGSVVHPMEEAHYIEWILVEQGAKTQYVHLKPGEEPVAHFTVEAEGACTVYEYCNLHGLWKAEA
jgi:superoxide reductase